jgi:hypothetical protein
VGGGEEAEQALALAGAAAGEDDGALVVEGGLVEGGEGLPQRGGEEGDGLGLLAALDREALLEGAIEAVEAIPEVGPATLADAEVEAQKGGVEVCHEAGAEAVAVFLHDADLDLVCLERDGGLGGVSLEDLVASVAEGLDDLLEDGGVALLADEG